MVLSPDAFFSRTRASHHLGEAMRSMMASHPLFGGESFDQEAIAGTHPLLSASMDHLNEFAAAISLTEMRYQELLDHPSLDLEDQVKLAHLARGHVLNLKRLHAKQKDALTEVTMLFLRLSKERLKMEKRG